MMLRPTFLIFRSGFAPTNGTSVQLQRLFAESQDSVVHLMFHAREAGTKSVRWTVNTDDSIAWKRPFGRVAAFLQRARGWMGSYWWKANRLNSARLSRELAQVPLQPRQALISYMNEWDASRDYALWKAVDRPPFVLYIVDILEPELSPEKTPNFIRLIGAASHVLCLNRLIEREMKRFGAAATSLFPLCSDLPSTARTFPPGPLKILISGALYASMTEENSALRLLRRAWPEVERRFPGAEIHYSGAASRDLPAELRPQVRDHGLLSFEAYQQLLHSCHLAYVPVAHLSQSWLRYSFPSRIPDYLVCGLPVVACTEEGTGIHEFFESAPRECTRLIKDEAGLASVLHEFAGTRENWDTASQAATAYARTAFSVPAAREELFRRLNAARDYSPTPIPASP